MRSTTAAALAAMALLGGGSAQADPITVTTPLGHVTVDPQLDPTALLGSGTCALCANVVTTYDAPGPAGPVTRLHRNVVANVPTALDVDGSLPQLPLGVLPVLPGYELAVTVQALDPARPTITFKRLVPVLPVKAEVVTGDLTDADGDRRAVGYDARDSTAPQQWTVALDLRARDADPATTQVAARVTTTGAPARLTLVEEDFKGNPVGARQERHQRRFTLGGDGTTTRVPRTVSLDLTTSGARKHAVLTHDGRSRLDVEVLDPEARTTGRFDELPREVELTLDAPDLDGDGDKDTTIDYVAAAAVREATLQTVAGGTTTDLAVTDLPDEAHLTYAAATAKTKLTYRASARATRAVLRSSDATRTLSAEVDGLPAVIDELSSTTRPDDGGLVVVDARDHFTKVRVQADETEGGKHVDGTVRDLPGGFRIDYGPGKVHYDADADSGGASVEARDGTGQRTTLAVDAIPAVVHLDLTKAADGTSTYAYHASAPVGRVEVHGTGLPGLPGRADELHGVLEGLPTDVQVVLRKARDVDVERTELPPPERCEREPHPENDPYCPQGAPDGGHIRLYRVVTRTRTDEDVALLTPGPGRLGHAELLITSGPDERLPATTDDGRPLDGVLLRDVADRWLAAIRASEVDRLVEHRETLHTHVTNPGVPPRDDVQSRLHAELVTNAEDHGLEVRLERQEDANDPVATTLGTLASLPATLTIDQSTNSVFDEQRVDVRSSRVVDGYTVGSIDGRHVPGFRLVELVQDGQTTTPGKDVVVDPLPTRLVACQHSVDPCSDGRFDRGLEQLRDFDGPFRTFACAVAGCGERHFPFGPGDATKGSLKLESDVPTNLVYRTGNYRSRSTDFTDVDLRGLRRFVLQGHKREYGCDLDLVTCKAGYIGLDVGGHGRITQLSGTTGTDIEMPEGFVADRLVWGFHKTGAVSGVLATVGGLTCPDGTRIKLAGETITERICDGDLFEGTILDQF